MSTKEKAAAVVPQVSADLVIPDEMMGEFDAAHPDIDRDAIQIPWVAWNLAGGKDVAGKPKKKEYLYVSGDDLPLDGMIVTPLEVIEKGARWKTTQDGKDSVLHCVSRDRVNGTRTADAAESPMNTHACEPCGRMRFRHENGQRVRPECSQTEDVALWWHEEERVVLVRFKSLGRKEWHKWLNAAVLNKMVTKNNIRTHWPFPAIKFRLGTIHAAEVIDNETRDYYLPRFSPLARDEDDRPLWLQPLDDVKRCLEIRKTVIRELKEGGMVATEEVAEEKVEAANEDDDGDSLPF